VAEPELRGAHQAEWLARLEREHDNLRASLSWCLQNGQVEKALRLGGALWRFWYWHGHLNEGRMWLEGALAAALGSVVSPAIRAKALNGAGTLASVQADYRRAFTLLEASLELWRELGDKRGVAITLNSLGSAMYDRGDFDSAFRNQEESLALAREIGDKWGIASTLNSLGELARCRGDYAAARSLYQESLALRQELGNKVGIAVCLHNLGYVAQHEQDASQASALFAEALSLAQEAGDMQSIAECLTGMAGVLVSRNQPVDAARLFGSAEAIFDSISAGLEPADRAERDRNLAAARKGQTDDAAFSAAWAAGRTMPLEKVVEFALENSIHA
jgi:tetratricopeptide (TPR) repeat protein